MVEMVNFIIAMLLGGFEFIYFWFILPSKSIKVKETDSLQKVRQRKMRFEISLLTLGFISIIFFYICILHQFIIGIYEANVILFFLMGLPVIEKRITTKEEMMKRAENNKDGL